MRVLHAPNDDHRELQDGTTNGHQKLRLKWVLHSVRQPSVQHVLQLEVRCALVALLLLKG